MKPYSEDLRKAAVTAYRQGGKSQSEIAALFGIHYKTLQNWLRMDDAGLEQKPQGKGHRPRILDPEQLENIRDAILKNNSLTVWELRKIIGISCSLGVYKRALKELGFSYKKNGYTLRNKSVAT